MGAKKFKNRNPLGCLVVGAEAANPEKVKLKELNKDTLF